MIVMNSTAPPMSLCEKIATCRWHVSPVLLNHCAELCAIQTMSYPHAKQHEKGGNYRKMLSGDLEQPLLVPACYVLYWVTEFKKINMNLVVA
jgi:hypothetical protein